MSAYEADGAEADGEKLAAVAALALTLTGAPAREETISAAMTPPPSDAARSVSIAVERRKCMSLAIS